MKKKINTGDKYTDALYSAVRNYIEEHGGKVVVIGGVSVMHGPTDYKYNFSLLVRFTGKKPS